MFPGTVKVKVGEAVAQTNYSGTSVEVHFDKVSVKKSQYKAQSPFQMTEDGTVLSSGEVRSSEIIRPHRTASAKIGRLSNERQGSWALPTLVLG